MANYTGQEIQAAVEKLVRNAIRRPYGTLGNRQFDTTFNDYQEAAAGTLILFSNAPFYVVELGTERLAELLVLEALTVASLLEAVVNSNRNVKRVDNVSSLANALVSLSALELATSARTISFNDIDEVPAFARFDANTQLFLNRSSVNIRKNGSIVPTPQESRASIAGLVSSLKAQHAEIVRRVTALSSAIEDYNSLNLPSLLSRSVIRQARSVLSTRAAQLEALDSSTRNSIMREVTLDILASRAVVRNFSALTGPGTFVRFGSGATVAAFADATHPATSAKLVADVGDPYPVELNSLVDTTELDVVTDGSFSFLLPLLGSFAAKLETRVGTDRSIIGGGLAIVAGVNDFFIIRVDGLSDIPVALTAGANQLYEGGGTSIVDDINTAIGANPLVAESYLFPVKVEDAVDTTFVAGVIASFTRDNGDWSTLPVAIELDDELEVVAGDNAGLKMFVSDMTGLPTSFEATSFGSAPITATNDVIRVGTKERRLRIRLIDSYVPTALAARTRMRLPALTTLKKDTLQTLGYFPDLSSTCRLTRVEDIKGGANAATGSVLGDVAQLSVGFEFAATTGLTGLGFRSNTSNPNRGVVYSFKGRVNVDGGAVSNIQATGSGTFAVVGLGDQVVIRATIILADQLLVGAVTTIISATELEITWVGGAPSASTNVLLEVYPLALATLPLDSAIVVDDGLNAGEFRLVRQEEYDQFGTTLLIGEWTMGRPLPFSSGLSGQPEVSTCQVGSYYQTFSSRSTLTNTKVEVNDGGGNPESGAGLFFNTLPAIAVGTTPYLQLSELAKGVTIGDVVEYYLTDFKTVSFSHTIIGIETTDRLVEVDPPVPTDRATLSFDLDITFPFARVRNSKQNNYSVFKAGAAAWLSESINSTRFFRDLDARVNALTRTSNPTLAEVNTAKLQLQGLLKLLTEAGATNLGADPALSLEGVLNAYVAEPVGEVDALIESFVEKGADRATDILLEGRFTTFFGLNQNTSSYAGTVLEGIQELSREDLPVRKGRRKEVIDGEMVLGEFEEPDFEFDYSDLDPFDEVELPGENFTQTSNDTY